MATVFVFNNVSGGDWNTSANWTPNGVPAAGDTAQISGGTFTVSTTQNETIAILDTAKSVSGAGLAPGAVLDVHARADLYLSGAVANKGTISVGDANGGASLLVNGSATLSGGGSVALAGATVTTDPLASGTLTNLDNKIHGWGQFALLSGASFTLVNKGSVTADSATGIALNCITVSNSGTLAGTPNGALSIIGGSVVSNANLIEALGAGAAVEIDASTVVNTPAGVILDSGNGAHLELGNGAAISGGTLKTAGAGAVSFGGTVTGFGSGGNHIEAIDFADINSAGAHFTYSALNLANTSGTLTVISGATSATVTLIGTYTSGNFTLGNDGNGHVLITDPPVVAQKPGNAAASIADGTVLEIDVADSGKVTFGGTNGTLLLDDASLFTGAVGGFRGLDRIDLAQIGFGAETTLGYSANAAGTGGTLRLSDGAHTASIALLGSYMAASFATAADGHGGTFITEAEQAAHGPSLTSPRHA